MIMDKLATLEFFVYLVPMVIKLTLCHISFSAVVLVLSLIFFNKTLSTNKHS